MPASKRVAVSTLVVVGVLVVVVAVAGIAYYALSYGGGGGTSTCCTTSTATPSTVEVSMPAGVGASQTLNFQPATITIVIGVNNTITWTNNDSTAHTVTSTSAPTGASFDSGNMPPGATYTHTFTTAGTYSYQCNYHPVWMTGTIIVKG